MEQEEEEEDDDHDDDRETRVDLGRTDAMHPH